MKKNSKAIPQRAAPRELYNELTEGMTALAEARQGKRTLPTHAIDNKRTPPIIGTSSRRLPPQPK